MTGMQNAASTTAAPRRARRRPVGTLLVGLVLLKTVMIQNSWIGSNHRRTAVHYETYVFFNSQDGSCCFNVENVVGESI